MGWSIVLPGLPEGYEVVEQEDGLTLLDPRGTVVAVYGPMLSDLDQVMEAAWHHARSGRTAGLLPVL
ncbi:MAG: hypothetical protein QN168_02385 [Armatimonadota bacterium]|nr:hypothetical protein [Armatimonadota bacterium]